MHDPCAQLAVHTVMCGGHSINRFWIDQHGYPCDHINGSGQASPVKAVAVQSKPIRAQPCPLRFVIPVEILHDTPEVSAMVHVLQMCNFMRGDIVQHISGREDKPPRIHQRTCAAARPPPRPRIAQCQLGIGKAQLARITIGCLCQAVTRHVFQKGLYAARGGFGITRHREGVIGQRKSPPGSGNDRAVHALDRKNRAYLDRRMIWPFAQVFCNPLLLVHGKNGAG